MRMWAVLLALVLIKPLLGMALTNSVIADEPLYDALVTLQMQGVDEEGQGVPGFCNGTILSEKIILTAAHCLVQSQVLNKKVIQLQIGKYKYVQNPKGQTVLVGYGPIYTQIELNPDFAFKKSLWKKMKKSGLKTLVMPYEDMAIIKLRATLPLAQYGIQPAKIASAKQWNKIRRGGALLPTVTTINYFAELTSTNVRRKATLDQVSIVHNQEGYYIKSTSDSRVEPLDSGSPVFIRVGGQDYVVAITKGRAVLDEANWDVYPILVYSLPRLYFN